MVRLRELASVTALAIAAMMALMLAGQSGGVQVPGGTWFHFAASSKSLRLASNQPNAQLRLGDTGLLPQLPSQPLLQAPLPKIDPAVASIDQALDRIRTKVSPELASYFDVFLYVSKSAEGPLAQHMFIFKRDAHGAIAFEQLFPVSTGRERFEKYYTTTPVGLFELDPNRFEEYHYSRTWHAAMPWSMFLNAMLKGRQTGIALHSAGGHVAALGHRASGGCVRLPPEKAAELFHRFQAEERGYVPVFAFDYSANRTSQYGELVRDRFGKPITYYGYKVLLVLEDYPGGPIAVAAVV